jgi:hypothetical protein
MKTEKSILFACFAGAALGAAVALQLHYFWWVGLLVGGATGYLSYSLREVINAAVTAWNTLAGGLKGRAWKTALRDALVVLAVLACVLVGAASTLLLSVGALALATTAPESSPIWTEVPAVSGPMQIPRWFWISAVVGVLVLGGILSAWILRSSDRKQAWMAVLGCIAITPLVLPITLGVVFLGAIIPKGARFMWRMARLTFILTHSQMRLLCMTDASVGALIGYLCGNALIGGAIGAVLGLVDYRFTSMRWLKLAKG